MSKTITLRCNAANGHYPKLGLHFRNGETVVDESRIAELKEARGYGGGKLWNQEFGLASSFGRAGTVTTPKIQTFGGTDSAVDTTEEKKQVEQQYEDDTADLKETVSREIRSRKK